VTSTPTLGDVVALVHGRYDPATAEDWDAVGLVCGDPAQPVRRVLVAVDAVEATVREAIVDVGADLLVTHHPLLLRPVSSVAATTPAGRLVHRLVLGGCALLAAHTNADVARNGVNEALAAVLGVMTTNPLIPSSSDPGAGLGRVGQLSEPTTLREFADLVAAALPVTAHGVRVSGDPAQLVRHVAVVGGSGADALEAARVAGVDVVVTSDLKHHAALDNCESGGPALIDVAHFASEWPWVPAYASLLRADLAASGYDVEVGHSSIVTDPWSFRA
jgi:dinuclear metal center YbgI/SA1388 family protein